MSVSSEALQAQVGLLRQTYAEQLPAKIGLIEEAGTKLLQGAWNEESSASLHRLTHSLAGYGATFGFPGVGIAARALEVYVRALVEAGTPPTAEQRAQLQGFLAGLQRALEEVSGGGAAGAAGPELWVEALPRRPKENRLVFLAEPDPFLAESLALQIGTFGYTVRSFPHLASLHEALRQTMPAAVIVELLLADGSRSAFDTIAQIRQPGTASPPLVFLADSGDLKVRLQAVRAGGAALFAKPVNLHGLIDKLDTLTSARTVEPYRILIVEDEAALAAHYASILHHAGMTTAVVTDPLQITRPLVEFRPDLILTDVYMAGCTGMELAAAIRQQEAYVSIPIVFLSAESNLQKQLAALGVGGDDFLTKPIEPDHLIFSVTYRAERSRVLRSFMVRDSLTGLLNHIKIKEQLGIELARAQRWESNVAFAMIDLDHFKEINDRYGHPTGDRVLKSLARLLVQRLRKIDIVGRYGGEEFAVILIETGGTSAVHVLEEIRQSFATLRHQVAGQEFSVTLSCGIASYPDYADVVEVQNAADQALYEAKHAGRNRVVLANAVSTSPGQ
jgi:diguanylate cyclase (GGDEF)-like protein